MKLWEPNVTEPEYTHPRYRSSYQYISDPLMNTQLLRVSRLRELMRFQDYDCQYSSRKKAFYPVVPYNTQTFSYLPVMGHFDFTRLRQTNVLDQIYSRQPLSNQFGIVSLSQTISPLLNKMGTMRNPITGENLGTCTLIAENLVMVARHAIQDLNVQNIEVTFGYTEFDRTSYAAGHTSFDNVIEDDISCDYAIVKLKKPVGKRLGYVPLNTQDNTVSEPALLHYPLGKSLKVSVHTFVQTQYQTSHLLANHDSDYFSSGGAYFDPLGHMTAMHLGTQLEGDTMNLLRYAMPLQEIVRYKPNSILQKFAEGTFSQERSYTSDARQTYLYPAPHNYLIDEEGYQSEKVLRKLLKNHLKIDKKIRFTKSGAISFSKTNLQYIADNYPREFSAFREKCLGVSGTHGLTKQYSVKGVIESDHTIPHNVWKSTTNQKMRRLVTGGGTRPGENDMPAITIPYGKHRELQTTGSSNVAKAFHKTLVRLCNQDKIDDALILCFREYAAHGIKLKDYKKQIKDSLTEHVSLGVISAQQKQRIITKLFS